jgi:hypothetical protein
MLIGPCFRALLDGGAPKRCAGLPHQANHKSPVLAALRNDRYYLGSVTYNGEEFPGRHEPLVTAELFGRVQPVLDGRLAKTGERQRTHHHYLKSTLWCGRCHDQGRESPMLLTRAKGRGGEYWSYFCIARRDRDCDAPYLRLEDAEAAVLLHPRRCGCLKAWKRGCAKCWTRPWRTRSAASALCTST